MELIHDPARLIAFVTFSAVVAGTPGPSNALLTAIGTKVGIRRGLPSLLGQVAGMAVMLFTVALGLGSVLLAHPLVLNVLKWSGLAVLCWLAWRIATARHTELLAGRAVSFLGMAAFQWINPKGWLISVAAVASFLTRRAGDAPGGAVLAQAVVLAVVFAVVAIPSCLPWLGFGTVIERFTRTERASHAVNVVLAVLLVLATVPLLWVR